jgi:cytochrome c
MKSRFLWIGLTGFALSLTACAAAIGGVPETKNVPQGDVEQGRSLMISYGCGSCHTIPGVTGADAKVGPPLNDFYERTYVAGLLPNTWENLSKWIQHPQQVLPHNAMPDLGVSESEARDMAAYLYHQPNLFDFLRR